MGFPWPRLVLCLIAIAWGTRTAIRCRRRARPQDAGSPLLALSPGQVRIQGILIAAIGCVGAIVLLVQHWHAGDA